MNQTIYLKANNNDTLLIMHNDYEYGNDKQFKTYSAASSKAIKDFNKECKAWFKESLQIKVNIYIELVDAQGFIIKNIKIKSNQEI